MIALERIKRIGERWFLTEPLLFAVYCSHDFCENDSLDVGVRTGNRKVEYAPHILDKVCDSDLLEYLKVEMFRILLKHPYQRQPSFAVKALLTQASNITITDVYDIVPAVKKQLSGAELNFPHGLCFEEYYNLLKQSLLSDSSNGENSEDDCEASIGNGGGGFESSNSGADGIDNDGGSCGDGTQGVSGEFLGNQEHRDMQISELWDEDEEACCDVNGFIEFADASNMWGTIPSKLQCLIKASLKVDVDYRKMLSLFKTSVISSKRRLTRMRPNRRFGFDAMGSRYELLTNLLIAVDVSGSVSDKSLEFFFSVINRLFKYGIEKIDVLQFDAEIQGKPESLKKVRRNVKILGRGGTCFQPAADYYCIHPEYDGLIYFTDGYASPPAFNTKRPIDVLWVLCSKSAYEANCNWIRELKRNRVTYIPGNK